MKFLAWNLSMFERVLLVDSDVCITSDPSRWVHLHRSEYFVGIPEVNVKYTEQRGYLGLTTHMMLLQPSPVVFKILIDQGVSRSYVPATNTEQDVLETVFSPHKRYPPMMRHRHHFTDCLGHNVSSEGHVVPPLSSLDDLDFATHRRT
jgi:hypothetical protein